jgi:isopenicillin N synthase-like dioxygenase
MSYAEARRIALSDIPVIDASALMDGDRHAIAGLGVEFRRAAEAVGFFYLCNHGIAQDLIDSVFAVSRAFFSQPPAVKQRVAARERHRGWLKVGEATMPDGRLPDLKESFIWGLDGASAAADRLIGPNEWPDTPAALRPLLNRYFDAANHCGVRLLQAFAASLDIDPDYFTRHFDRPASRGTMIYYPPQPPSFGNEQFGVSPHTDFGVLTLLYQDDVGGLQVRGRDGDWLTAHPVPGTLVVNVGDLLARWTNDRFKSTPHRVINASGRERYSLAMFVDPDETTPIAPVVRDGEAARYPTVTCASYIQQRFDQAFAYRKAQG